MIDINDIKEIVKILYVCIFSYFTYIKITNSNNTILKSSVVVGIGLIIACLSFFANKYISELNTFIIATIILGITMYFLNKDRNDKFILAYIISIAISYILYLLSILFSGIILKILIPDLEYTNKVFILGILICYILLFWLLCKIKRFKNGFKFINRFNNNTLLYCMLIIVASLSIFSILKKVTNIKVMAFSPIAIAIISVIIYLSIKSCISMYYKKNMHDRTIEMQKLEIDQKIEEIEGLKSENLKLGDTIHKYNHRLSALENGVKHAMENFNTEFSGELSILLDEIKTVSSDLAKETERNVSKLPLTNIVGIDNVLQYMKDECEKSGIYFSIKIVDNIDYLIEQNVAKEKLEILIADHLKDAIIAINSGDGVNKSMLVVMGIVKDKYEISIYDTGIDFEIDTLLKLGEERITTHKDTGGTGIGFMTTFETLNEYKASVIIEEYDKATTYYTKSISFRFDGKNEYKIYSYRANEIKKKCKGRKISINKI